MHEGIQKSIHLSASCLFLWVCEQPMVSVDVWFHHADRKHWVQLECCPACHWHTFLLGCDPRSDRVEQRDTKELPELVMGTLAPVLPWVFAYKGSTVETEAKALFCLFFNYLCTCMSVCTCVSVWKMCTWVSCLWRPEEEPESPEAGVTGSCKQLYLTTESNLQALETWLYGNL